MLFVETRGRPIIRYRGFKVYSAKRHFNDFAGSNNFDKVIVVSPRFLKLNKETQRRILDHEVAESMFFDKHLPELEQQAHRYACRKVGFPTNEFAIHVGWRGAARPSNSVAECLRRLGVR